MSDETPRLRLAQLVSLQELNAVTWNEALAQLDALVDLCLSGQYVNTPPSSPSDGDAYLIGGAPTGAWSGQPYKIAVCLDGAWRFYTPFNGLRAYVTTTGAFIVYLNGVWTDWNSLISANEVSVGSAATCDLGATGALFVQITGTATITGFGTAANRLRFVRFAQALTLTHNAASLNLIGAMNRTTAAGDVGIYSSDASGNWRERSYFRAADASAGVVTVTSSRRYGINTPSPLTALHFTFNSATTDAIGCTDQSTDDARTWRTGPGVGGAAQWGFYDGNAVILALESSAGSRSVKPGADNAQNLGVAARRWKEIFCAHPTFTTSVADLKSWRGPLGDDEYAAGLAILKEIGGFRYLAAIAEKGEAARLHFGVRAQRLKTILEAHGLDPFHYAFLCYDEWPATASSPAVIADKAGGEVLKAAIPAEPAGHIWGIRPAELQWFLIAVIDRRLDSLEAA